MMAAPAATGGALTTPAPIALFAFNRPVHLARTAASLAANHLAAASDLWVFCDGPRHAEDEADVREVRKVATGITGFASVSVVERQVNAGLAASVMAGVTRLCESSGRAIVVEDDLVLSPHFLQFINEGLDRFADEERAMQVTGYMFPGSPAGLPESFFTRLPSSWGWGTWRRAWQKMDPDAASLQRQIRKRGLARSMDLDCASGYLEMLRYQVAGRLDSWAIRWYASMLLGGGLALRPARSLVSNAGMDGSGVHCDATGVFDVDVAKEPVRVFPDAVEECAVGVEAIRAFYLSRCESLARRALRRLRRGVSALGRQSA